MWGAYHSTEQKAGVGDGSDGLFDNRTNYEDLYNIVSVIGYAFDEWEALIQDLSPDVIVGADGSTSNFMTSWGTALALAPKGGDQLSVANRDETFYIDPKAIVAKYRNRFNEGNNYYYNPRMGD
jgi:hypothetical protein